MKRFAAVVMLGSSVLVGAHAISASAQQSSDTVSPRATTMMPMHDAPMQTMPHGMMARHFDRSIAHRIDDMHAKLRITSAQEEQWGKVAEIMRQNAAEMEALVADRSTAAGAIDQLRRYEKLAEAHLDGLKKFVSEFASLYASLSGDQRVVAGSLFLGRVGAPERRPG